MTTSIEEQVEINGLIDFYGNLLTDSQLHVLKSYYQYDLSLSEIACELKISRSAVLDALNKAKNKLKEIEEKLHYYRTFEELLNNNENDKDKDIIKRIKRRLQDGI